MNPQYMTARPMGPAFGYGSTHADHGPPPSTVSSQNGPGQPPMMGMQPQRGPGPFPGPPMSGPYNPIMPTAKQGPAMTYYGQPDGMVQSTNQNIGFVNGAGPTPPPSSQPGYPAGSSFGSMASSAMSQQTPQHGTGQSFPEVPPTNRFPVVRPYLPPASGGGGPPMINQMAGLSLGEQQQSQQQHLPPRHQITSTGPPLGHVSPMPNKPPPQQISVPPYSMSASHHPGQASFQPPGPVSGNGAGHVPPGARQQQLPVSGLPSAFPNQPPAGQPNVYSGPPQAQHGSYSGPPPQGQSYPQTNQPSHHAMPSMAPPGPAAFVPGGARSTPPSAGGNHQNVPRPPPPSVNGQSYNAGPAQQPLPAMPNQYGGPLQNQGPPRQPSGGGMHPGPMSGGMQPGPMPGGGMQPGVNQGFNRMQQGPAMGPGSMQPQQQPQRRLDPEMMPSPIQVIEDDRKNREGVFCTNERGAVPPLVTTHFVTQDQGNCNPRFIRSSMYSVPNSPDMMKQSSIPFTLTISPFASLVEGEVQPPIVNLGEIGPVRCIRCKAYMCPYVQFIDGGRRFQCNFCRATTDVPPEYFAHLDHTGHRVDKYERPELCLGSYEFVATKDYCKNNVFPSPPAFIFIIDVSYSNMRSGMVHLLCDNIKEVLANLPREHISEESQVKVGFITYNSCVQFYNLNGCLAQPQVMVVPDVQEMFMPLLDGFLVSLQESETLIDSLMEQIPQLYEDCRDTETILGPAIKAGLEALKAAERSGKLFVFHSSLPIADAPGRLKNRDDRKLLGTDKEKAILAPQTPFYNQLAQECVTAACSVDLFTFPNAYIDIATIGQICRLTGGQLHKYTYFHVELDGTRFIEDLKRSVHKQVAFDAIMRVRTSTGIRPTEFYGNYYMSNTTDVELAAMDSDKAICVEIKHDDKLTDEDAVFIQAAILYTSVGGQRRLRIHNLSLNTCGQMADLYRNCELDTLMNYFAKACLRKLCDQTPKQVRDYIISKCAASLACYRKNCANPSSAGQLILPECMKLSPLYCNCLLKSDAISGGTDITVDDRSFAMHALNTMDVGASLSYFYPRLIPLHDLDPNNLGMPTALRCSVDKLRDNGAYLLENGIFMFLWIGLNVESSWLVDVFGVQSAAQIDIDKTALLLLDNPVSLGVRRVVSRIREERQRCLKLIIVRQRDKLEMVFKHFLVEDKGMDNSPCYVDFVRHVHNEIRNILS